ncbi:RNase adapter RapZ [Desulfonema magnum]|uniref:Nucleotide-binding protein n=1 Tax=Desulfonema magnum TaxID=45655 RepID=A0A975BJT5_9BACT|nr:RNase adapter RapZ [Desulfonema magnum]QTA86455.1 Nucleotide-binding protein [Desulfonema magnum]
MNDLKIFIITGLSGSGKSTAIAAFQDAGFYCVDNMPVALLPKFLELPIQGDSEITGLAFVMDLREKGFLSGYEAIFESLRQKGCNFEILFLEADEKILVQRYSQTRRYHPLSHGKSVTDGIRIERDQLRHLRESADQIIDTSCYNVHKLKSLILDIAQKIKKFALMKINILSFGFRYGIPHDADLIIDVRFVSNPYFVPELKELDGEKEEVRRYVLSRNTTRIFLQKYLDLLDYLIPLYEKEGKAYLTIGVGCTGGRHRSVAIARAVFEHTDKPNRRVEITHRDIEK